MKKATKSYTVTYATRKRGEFITRTIKAATAEEAWHEAAYNWTDNPYGRQGRPAPLVTLIELEDN